MWRLIRIPEDKSPMKGEATQQGLRTAESTDEDVWPEDGSGREGYVCLRTILEGKGVFPCGLCGVVLTG